QRAHVRQRFVRIANAHIVGLGQVFELERGALAVLALRPLDAIGAQRVRQSHHVQQVPAAVAAAPFALVGVEEIAEQAVADELVVEAQRVEPRYAAPLARNYLVDAGEGAGFANAYAQGLPRVDAGHHARPRGRQQVAGGADQEIDRLV